MHVNYKVLLVKIIRPLREKLEASRCCSADLAQPWPTHCSSHARILTHTCRRRTLHSLSDCLVSLLHRRVDDARQDQLTALRLIEATLLSTDSPTPTRYRLPHSRRASATVPY